MNFENHIASIYHIMSLIEPSRIKHVTDLILSKWRTKNCIYLFGNGGSAYIASHFALDLFKTTGKYIKAISLCNDAGIVLAIGNDFDFKEVVRHQLYGGIFQSDLVIFFTTSGNSENIIKGIDYCKYLKVDEISFVGLDGGIVNKISQYPVYIPSDSVTMTESIFSILCHYITDKIRDEPVPAV